MLKGIGNKLGSALRGVLSSFSNDNQQVVLEHYVGTTTVFDEEKSALITDHDHEKRISELELKIANLERLLEEGNSDLKKLELKSETDQKFLIERFDLLQEKIHKMNSRLVLTLTLSICALAVVIWRLI